MDSRDDASDSHSCEDALMRNQLFGGGTIFS